MKRHINYLKYLIRHKYFVFKACRYCDVSLWRAIVHDMSKFLPSEWNPYASTFYKENGDNQYKPTTEFNMAWLKHQHRNKHHWQYWVLRMDDGTTVPMRIPEKYMKEMVADWMGAGRAITGRWEVEEWYQKNKYKINLHPKTEDDIDILISKVKDYKG